MTNLTKNIHIELIKSYRNNRIYIENILNNFDKIYTTFPWRLLMFWTGLLKRQLTLSLN